MRGFKYFSTLLILLLLVSCGSNPTKKINANLKQSQKYNNQIIDSINVITDYESEYQEAFEIDLNNEELDTNSSELLKVIANQEKEVIKLNSLIDSLDKEVEKLYEIDLSKLEKGHDQLDVIKENLNTQVKHFREVSKTLTSQFEYALEVIEIASEEDPSIQDFQTAFFSLNDDSKALHLILSTIKENSQQLYESIKAWNLVFDISDDKTVDNNVNTDDPIDLKPPFSITRYTLDKNYYIKPIDDANEKIVLLTFDDCVQPEPNSYTLDIAKTLKAKGVSAIFFFNGMFLESQHAKDVLKEVYDMGFVIGNHTYSHPYLNKLNYEQTQAEIVSTSDLIEEVIGVRPKMFRPSFGILGDYGAQVVEEEGMLSMNWTYGYDWESQYMEAEPLADIMVNTPYLTSGANLLMHDRKWTAAAIGDIIDGLIEKGYEIVDPSEILVPGDN